MNEHKLYNFYFDFEKDGHTQTLGITAENLKDAKEQAAAIENGLEYANDYDELQTDPYVGQKIAWVCSTPADELPLPFKWGKKLALLLAYGTNCQCCLGYRIMAGIVAGGVIGWLLG